MYCNARVADDPELARNVQAFVGFCTHARNWQTLAGFKAESEKLLGI
jgi:hypothetical protein